MKGKVKDDVSVGGDEDDPIIKEFPVYISTELTPFLHILSLPSQQSSTHLNDSTTPVPPTARFKKTSRRLEVSLPFNTHTTTFDRQRAEELAVGVKEGTIKGLNGGGEGKKGLIGGQSGLLDQQKLTGSALPWSNTQYMIGAIKENALFLTPVNSTIPLRPSLTYLDEIDARNKATTRKIAAEDAAASNPQATSTSQLPKTIQMQFRKKETEEQVQARLNSYAYLQRQVDDEAWIDLSFYPSNSTEVGTVCQRLFASPDQDIRFREGSGLYVDKWTAP